MKEIFSRFVLFSFEAGVGLCVDDDCDLTNSVCFYVVMGGLRFVFWPFMLCLAIIVSNFQGLVNVQRCSDEW